MKPSVNIGQRIFAGLVLLCLVNVFVPFHQLLHKHKDSGSATFLHIKKKETSCCKITDILHLTAIKEPFKEITFLKVYTDNLVSLLQKRVIKAAILQQNKAPPVFEQFV